MICSLCAQQKTALFFRDAKRRYYRCDHCALVFVAADEHLRSSEEKAEYDKHQNSSADQAYRRFLNRLVLPLIKQLPAGAQGLDFGCGPGPAVPQMLREHGFSVTAYDPIYLPDAHSLQQEYDFVVATEVIEHLREPAQTLELVWRLLKAGGLFGVMTKLVLDRDRFSRWHYKNDPTHIAFYSLQTLHFLARRWRAEFIPVAKDAFIFKKSNSVE